MADIACKPTATASVLGLYELLDSILYYVYPPYDADEDKCEGVKQSTGLLRVNKLWFSVAVKYVWATLIGPERPRRSDLELLVNDPERLRTYARCIENLHIVNDGWSRKRPAKKEEDQDQEDRSRLHHLLPVVEIPRLRRLLVNSIDDYECILFSNPKTNLYLRDSLKFLTIRCLVPPPSFWTLLKDRCPNIEEFVQSGNEDDENPIDYDPNVGEAFQKFLESSKKLRVVWLRNYYHFDMVGFLQCLSQKSSLSTLHFETTRDFIGEGYISRAINAEPNSFRNLKKLWLCMTSAGFRLLESNLANLEELGAVFEEEMPKLQFKAPRNMPHLRHLSLYLNEGTFDAEELLRLPQYCPKLTYIDISSVWIGYYMDCPGVSNSVIETLSQLLPELQYFTLNAHSCSLTEQALLHFGRHCKALSRLEIPGTVDWIKFMNVQEVGLFPNLRKLEVRPGYDKRVLRLDTHEEACAIPDRISLMMPRLQELETWYITIEVPSDGPDGKTQYDFDWAMEECLKHGRNPFINTGGGLWPRPTPRREGAGLDWSPPSRRELLDLGF